MNFFFVTELVKDSLRNLVRHKVRSTLTLLGVVFGIASVITMLAVGEGAQRTVLQEIRSLGLKNIIIDSVKPPDVKSTRSTQAGRQMLQFGVTEKDVRQVAAIGTGFEVSIAHRVDQKVHDGATRIDAEVLGVAPEYFRLFGSELLAGAALSEVHEMQSHPVAVVTPPVADAFVGVGGAVGKMIRIGSSYIRVIGVVRVSGQGSDGSVFLPYSTARNLFGTSTIKSEAGRLEFTKTEIGRLVVHADDEASVPELARTIQRTLDRNHRVNDIKLMVPLDVLRSKQRTQRVFDLVLITIAAISLIVGGIGIMNIMLAIVMERIREIGVRRAIGARRRDIFLQFLAETVTLSSMGGVLGILVGFVMLPIASGWTGWEGVITPWAVISALVVSWTVGVVFGTAPAIRAARLDPVAALRHE
jgi:putative ABC transport system permease protein